MVRCPTLVIAGTCSGSGKTSLALAIARALVHRGLHVQTFKVGPDFLDPTYLALASGRPCYNLDGWMSGREYLERLFKGAVADADLAIVEGVMGLFDGADPETDEGSTAEIARRLDAPILLVVNVHGMARSLAALVKGFSIFEPDLCFTGVVANHCGSERHAAWLADSLKAAGLPPLLGALPRGAFPGLASRHLGLVTADSERLPEAVLDALAETVERHVSLERLFPGLRLKPLPPGRVPFSQGESDGGDNPGKEWATPKGLGESPTASPRPGDCQLDLFPEWEEAKAPAVFPPAPQYGPAARLRIGVARDAAFHFYYQELFDALAAAGCEIVFFSPLAEDRLPEGLSGLVIGGGYPEVHAAALSANVGMLSAIRAYAASGRPLYAECGGLMYLSEGIESDGRFHPLLGILPVRTQMLARKKTLGYIEVTLREDSLWGPRGTMLRGHEFHYSEMVGDPSANGAWRRVYDLRRRRSEGSEAEGFQKGAILASYTHLHHASQPGSIDFFLRICGGRP